AATHRDLRERVKASTFREDLFFRLDVLELDVPSLRDRKPEIPGLCAHFLAAARARNPTSVVRSIAPTAMRALASAPWPGNVRELASVVERLVVMGENVVATESDLALAGIGSRADDGPSLLDAQRELSTLAELDRRYVDWVLERTAGDKVEAARILGINLSTLYRWKRIAAKSS
ncbi:MAG: helix-turn-helix domain-containing protein, partial [Polyangiaceae bacterium]